MKNYIQYDSWSIIEEGFKPEYNRNSESLFSIGNGFFGQRANFEEKYTGDSLQGSYIGGVYYPDKTKVGWWKNGYPEYFSKVLNTPNWTGIDVKINDVELDLAKIEPLNFKRTLNMKEGYLLREFDVQFQDKGRVKIQAQRFISSADKDNAAIKYSVTADFDAEIEFSPYLDGGIVNEDANYDEKFWDILHVNLTKKDGCIVSKTKKTGFVVCTGITYALELNNKKILVEPSTDITKSSLKSTVKQWIKKGETISIYKYAVVISSLNHNPENILQTAQEILHNFTQKSYTQMLDEQKQAWAKKWALSDVVIEGDVAAQQGIRFNIFQLHQTYNGEDSRLNIGPKGFTGERYGGSTYWDTEAYCLPFYLSTAEPNVSRNLLVYRYNHLENAIKNAEKLGFSSGAALYPMVTMNGEEAHNEWEITFEEIHRNSAIAYAIFNYIRYTGEKEYLAKYGLEVLIAIARFWKQRTNFSEVKKKFVILGVTGPNEYENNVNNNWYTNTIACWAMEYAIDCLYFVKQNFPDDYARIVKKTTFNEDETLEWENIIANMYFPKEEDLSIFLQQEGYMDKEQIMAKDIEAKDLPLCQKWSWDRILRSCFIKQADVLQGIYFLEDRYDLDIIRRNYEFYEPRTVHESSLSSCIHSILAAKIGNEEKAYQYYLNAARLDLDDYNNDTRDGCHITSMAGTWLSIVQGFAGMRVKNDKLYFSPFIPKKWNSYSFKILFRNCLLNITVNRNEKIIHNYSDSAITITVNNKDYTIKAKSKAIIVIS